MYRTDLTRRLDVFVLLHSAYYPRYSCSNSQWWILKSVRGPRLELDILCKSGFDRLGNTTMVTLVCAMHIYTAVFYNRIIITQCVVLLLYSHNEISEADKTVADQPLQYYDRLDHKYRQYYACNCTYQCHNCNSIKCSTGLWWMVDQ